MEATNHQEEPDVMITSKRQYVRLDDVHVLPPLETLVVAIEGSADLAGVCCLSIPNRLLDDWAKNRKKNTSFVALANEYIADEAITLNPEATRVEGVLYRRSLGVASYVFQLTGRHTLRSLPPAEHIVLSLVPRPLFP